MFSYLLMLIVSITGPKFIYSCTCMRSSDEQQFCRADFVINGIVLRRIVESDPRSLYPNLNYEIKVIQAFKGQFKLNESLVMHSPPHEAACGVRISDNIEYLLSGQMYDNEPQLGLCNWNVHWNGVSEDLREKLAKNLLVCPKLLF